MSCITTFTGLHIDPADPNPDLLDIRDIAHALSLTCRGNGHVKTFYSVGQHCIACAQEAEGRGYSSRLILACLLHDASEAYMSDVPRPFKKVMLTYQESEAHLLSLIYTRFLGSDLTPEESALVKAIDDDLLYFDLRDLLNDCPDSEEPRMHIRIDHTVVPFESTELEYLNMYTWYSQEL